jgi:hypothetical protein
MVTSLVESSPTHPWVTSDTDKESEKPRKGFADHYHGETSISLVSPSVSAGGMNYTNLQASRWRMVLVQTEAVGTTPGLSCLGMVFVHGEADEADRTTAAQYAADLVQLQGLYEAKVHASTECVGTVPLWVNVDCSWTKFGWATPTAAIGAYTAVRDNLGKIFYTAEKCTDDYDDGGVHTNSIGTLMNAVRTADAVVDGPDFRGIWPWTVVMPDASHVVITFNVLDCPLVLDTQGNLPNSLVSNPGNFGFEYFCAASPPGISSVTLGSCIPAAYPCSYDAGVCASFSQTVTLTLATPSSVDCQATDEARYQYTGGVNQPAGPLSGPRGNLRDSFSGRYYLQINPDAGVLDGGFIQRYHRPPTFAQAVVTP